MIFSLKHLSEDERNICLKTISSKAIYALVGDALLKHESISIVRMGDGERKILASQSTSETFHGFHDKEDDWNKRLGIEGESVDRLQHDIIEAGNSCTYFAPSVSGISFPIYLLYQYFAQRPYYFDNFFINDWKYEMIQMLLEASEGVFIIHRDYKKIIQNFEANYEFKKKIAFGGCIKDSWQDNDQAIKAASNSPAQLILFSAGPGGKIIAPKIALTPNKIVLDVGNTLLPWSEKR